MDEFFKHETLSYPPSLAKSGQLRPGEKAEILPHLKSLQLDLQVVPGMPVVDATVIEGSVLANQINPAKKEEVV